MNQIVVGVDGSEPSYRALRWALDEAAAHGASVLLASTYRPPPDTRDRYELTFLPPEMVREVEQRLREARTEDRAQVKRRAEGVVRDAVHAVGGAPDGVETKLLVSADDPAKLLVELSADADLVVVGRRGRGGLTGLVLGSVSQKVIHHARCPVVVLS